MVWPRLGVSGNGTTMKSTDCQLVEVECLVVVRHVKIIEAPPPAIANIVDRHLVATEIGMRQHCLLRHPIAVVRRFERLDQIAVELQRGKHGLVGRRGLHDRWHAPATRDKSYAGEQRGPAAQATKLTTLEKRRAWHSVAGTFRCRPQYF